MKEKKTSCSAKHTRYQPDDEEFLCPWCGKGQEDGGLVIEYDDDDADDGCALLHNASSLECGLCGYTASGRAFAARLAREKNLVSCPTCKGKGMVRREGGRT